jgi:hypothetical protein
MGALMPGHPALAANQALLSVLSLFFVVVGWLLLQRQERYL